MKNINIGHIMISGIILLSLAFAINIGTAQSDDLAGNTTEENFEDIAPYEGLIGPSSALYGLKIEFENFGEIFIFNKSERIEKQIEHARSRLAEAKTEFRNNNDDYANIAIEMYREKIKAVDDSVSKTTGNASGLFGAQRKIVGHQFVLERLLQDFPDNKGLKSAVSSSAQLEQKFESRTDRRFMRFFQNEQKVAGDSEENDTRGGYPMNIPPMGWWE